MALLSVSDLTILFGGLAALRDVSFDVKQGQIFSIIGPNGAGKTTIFNCISGRYRQNSGVIAFNGLDISRKRPDYIARVGITRTFQNIELFSHMTSLDNILLGRHVHMKHGVLRSMFRVGKWVSREEIAQRKVAEEIIDFLEIQSARDQFVVNLPYGTRKLVELGRALALEPKLLLLDEPSAGMNLEERQDLMSWIRDIRDDLGITVVLVEHDMNLVMGISDEVLAINFGKQIARGAPSHVQNHPEVLTAYLGERQQNASGDTPGIKTSRRIRKKPGKKAEPLLAISNIETLYGKIAALKGISLEVHEGSIVAILGANGAGKSTLLKTVSGLIDDQPEKGTIVFRGKRIEDMKAVKVAPLGISYVPEGREIFPELTVMENLKIGAYARNDRDAVDRDLHKVLEYFPILAQRGRQMAGTLSGGEQQMLAISRGLMSRPRLLMLDEPSLGLAPILVNEIFEIVRTINEEGVTILLVEQNANMALSVADYGYVLETGRIVLSDTAQNLRENEDVKEFYLGVGKDVSEDGLKRYKRRKRWR
jgi:ABC-type branched-subunit amino acid transport system ATPase component